MASAGTLGKPREMNKSTPQWQSFLQMFITIIAIVGCFMNVGGDFREMKVNQENEKIKNDGRYIEQKDFNREIKNGIQDLSSELKKVTTKPEYR